MKDKVEIKENIYHIFHPKVTYLLTSKSKEGKDNVMALAWLTPLSEEPPLVGVAIGKDAYTSKNIKETKEFVINIPTISLKEKVWKCGTKSGEEVDKFELTKLTKEKAKKVSPCWIKECIAHIECKLKEIVDAGECNFFIGEIVYACASTLYFKEYWIKNELLLHLGGKIFAKFEKL
ncbi:MAG: flavin reductase family protein [candidate division WOR-3 bacterium]